MNRKPWDPQRDVDAQILHIRCLVLIRSLLADRGATPAELAECDDVIAAGRQKLAELAFRAGAYASAA
jgi:hypothetical protein